MAALNSAPETRVQLEYQVTNIPDDVAAIGAVEKFREPERRNTHSECAPVYTG